jgi:glutathione-specific gamma-glutamylcyclotransferase
MPRIMCHRFVDTADAPLLTSGTEPASAEPTRALMSTPDRLFELAPISVDADLWVFAYGSLMWRPGFAFVERLPARLHGFHRSLCVYSSRYRGTPEKPGLVLGLDRGGSCPGVAFRVDSAAVPDTIAYLRERELVTHVYREVLAPVQLRTGERTRALAYVVDRQHRQYAGRLPAEEMVRVVRDGQGISGPNRDYVLNTVAALNEMGTRDPALERIAAAL